MIRPIVAAIIEEPTSGRQEKIYAFLDTAADRDYISEECARRLGLDSKSSDIQIHTVDLVSKGGKLAPIKLKSLDRDSEMVCEDVVVGPFRARKFEEPLAKMDLRRYSHLDGIPFIDIEAKVEALICSAHIAAWFGDGLRR